MARRARCQRGICCGRARECLYAPGLTMSASNMQNSPLPKNRDSVEQDQFLTILSREEAVARFEAALFPRATLSETRPLAAALGHALVEDIAAPIDVPPFDRS